MNPKNPSIRKWNFYRFFITCNPLNHICKYRTQLFAFLIYALPSLVTAQSLVFVDFITLERSGLEPASDLPDNDFIPQATFFYSGEVKGIKLLAEYLANDIESQFGRLQIGFSLSPSHNLWFGRTDNPANYWRDQFHHGGWLQPTITRPGVAEYEVAGGIIPSHTTGIMLEGGSALLNNQNFGYIITAGYGPKLDREGLQVPSLAIRNRGAHNASYAFRAFYKFDSTANDNEIGLLGSLSHIAATQQVFKEVEQQTAGAYVNWHFGNLGVISEFVELNNNTVNDTGIETADDHFHNTYIQGVYPLAQKWNVYARAEGSSGTGNSIYLLNFPKFVKKRNMTGINYSLSRNQTLKMEIERSERLSGDTYNQLTIQWSFVYP
ncbi:hypothetical protein MNBD_GAMMA11-3340 [hydrothermal vent metagenome]|uniref:Uncharacterized protein n=1 Tax=hydrothermal vent metagenome TaxID=652676 RepID=A0A3B0YDL3_9ZZZZ